MKTTTTRILFLIIALLIVSTIHFYKKSAETDILGVDAYDQEQKCLSWVVYNPKFDAWRWRAETFNEYFPRREDAVSNCIVILNGDSN